jgi:hypothetical protein
LKERGLPQKAEMLLDNAPSHARESKLTANDGLIIVKFLPTSVTDIIQPMNKGVIASMKYRYRADLLRTLASEDDSKIALSKKNYGAGCYICHITCTVFCEFSNAGSIMEGTSSRYRRRFAKGLPDEEISKSKILDVVGYGKFENIDKDNAEEWLQSDVCKLGFKHMTDTDIANTAVKQKGEEEGGKDKSEEERQSSECVRQS